MKRRLMRPTAALFPLVGLIAALLLSAARDFVLLVYFAYYLVQLLSLCAVDSFRNAAACEPGVRRVDRRFGGAMLCALIGSALAMLLTLLFRPAATGALRVTDHAEYIHRMIFRATLAAACINFEHLFEERMFALGRRIDGVLLSCICNGMLLAGVLIDANAGAGGGILAIAAGLGAALAVATSYAIEPIHGFSLAPSNLAFAPRAGLQALLYPAAACAAALLANSDGARLLANSDGTLLLANGDGARLDAMLPAVLFGLIPWRLARTTARRSADESRPLNLLLIAFAAVPAVFAAFLSAARPYASAATLALLCGAAVFCASGRRLYVGIALVVAANLAIDYSFYLAVPLALAAIGGNLKRAFLRKM